ncbi:MAG: hypothetical protein ABI237_05710 [Ginsengibacter sp.]
MENKTAPANSDTVYYNSNRRLMWSDFRGTVPAGVPWGAMTASGFSFDSEMHDDGTTINITVGIFTFFTKHDSWKKPEINSAYHLEHEQHHFDITRLYSEKLMNEIKKAAFTNKNYKKLLNSLFNKVYDESIALQRRYDLETRNSMDSVKQLEWNKKISDEINNLQ